MSMCLSRVGARTTQVRLLAVSLFIRCLTVLMNLRLLDVLLAESL